MKVRVCVQSIGLCVSLKHCLEKGDNQRKDMMKKIPQSRGEQREMDKWTLPAGCGVITAPGCDRTDNLLGIILEEDRHTQFFFFLDSSHSKQWKPWPLDKDIRGIHEYYYKY